MRTIPFCEVTLLDEAEVGILMSMGGQPIASGVLRLSQPEMIPLLPYHHLAEIAPTGELRRHGTPLPVIVVRWGGE